jgi:hypothetical protein
MPPAEPVLRRVGLFPSWLVPPLRLCGLLQRRAQRELICSTKKWQESSLHTRMLILFEFSFLGPPLSRVASERRAGSSELCLLRCRSRGRLLRARSGGDGFGLVEGQRMVSRLRRLQSDRTSGGGQESLATKVGTTPQAEVLRPPTRGATLLPRRGGTRLPLGLCLRWGRRDDAAVAFANCGSARH